MKEERLREIAKEEMAKAIKENIDSALIFSYVKELETVKFEERCKMLDMELRIQDLEIENQMLKNTKNSCPHFNTSGINCNIKTDYISKEKIREKLEELKTLPIVVGGRCIGKTLEYGIRLGKKQILEELLEEE